MTDLTDFGIENPPSERPWKPPARDLDPYYALIELPSRRHIPYPMVEQRIIGRSLDEGMPVFHALGRWAQLRRRMTVGHRIRDERFFYCGLCAERDGWGWSYFRCREHRPLSPEEDLDKWHELQSILDDDRPEALEIVRAYRRLW